MAADTTLLNVSYDPTRELYGDFNCTFARHWMEKTREEVEIRQSHGRVSARSCRGGLYARLWEHQSGGFLGDESDEEEDDDLGPQARLAAGT